MGSIPLAKRLTHGLRDRFPTLARAYHAFRYSRQLQKWPSVMTPDGYLLRGNELMQRGLFEPAETQLLKRLLPGCDVFVDVGANIGYFACMARHIGTAVVAVEPHPENCQYLLANLQDNGWTDVEVLPLGLGHGPGILRLHGAGTGASLVEDWAGASSALSSYVPVSRFDDVALSRIAGRRALIKIDVEGAELPLLKGAAAALGAAPAPRWLVEICLTENHPAGINPDYVAVFDEFFGRGYDCASVEADMRPVTRDDVLRWAATRQRDFGYVSFLFSRP